MSDLPGYAIDTSEDPSPRRTILPRWVKAMVAFSTVLAAFSLTLSAILFARNDADSAARDRNQEQEVTTALYQIAYRICAREAEDRAYARTRDPEGAKKLVLLDCKPNLEGKPAKVLSNGEAREYLRRFQDGRLTLAERGICQTGVTVGDRKASIC